MSKNMSSLVAALVVASAAVAQDFTVNVPNSVRKQIGRILPERSNAGAAYLSEVYASNLVFNAAATARIIFIREGAGYQNSLGYFTYTDNVDGTVTINSADLLITNATEPSAIQRGDGFDLKDAGGSIRTFNAGEKLGFFIIADGNRQATSIVGGWTFNYSDSAGTVPSADPAVNETRGRGCYTSVSQCNPEMLDGEPDKARHMVMIKMPGKSGFLGGVDYIACGWEDLRRTGNSDDDFNDLLFVVDATPLSSFSGTSVFEYEPGDPDNDGVKGLNDAFPNDPTRATRERFPSSGHNMIAFEDKYPDRGDEDFNDAVIAYNFEVASDADGNVKDIMATVSLVARGASYDAAFGLHLPGLPPTATGTIRIERFVSGATTSTVVPTRTVQSIIANGTRRIPDIIESTSALLPPPSGFEFSNTIFAAGVQGAGSARVHIEFDTPIPAGVLGLPPYDPFLYVDNPNFGTAVVDIHLPGWPSFADRDPILPVEQGFTTFIDGNGFPWALEVPSGWRFPMELVRISDAYPQFDSWRASSGQQNGNWFLNPNSSTGFVGPTLGELLPVRVWTVQIPQ